MKNKAARVASILCCVGVSQTAAAADPGFYIGGYVLQSSKDVPRGEFEVLNNSIQPFFLFTPDEQRVAFDETDTGFAIMAGYRFTPYLAIEGGYTRLGQVVYRSRATGRFPLEAGTMAVNIESDTSGFTAAVLGTWPLTRNWELFGRTGALVATNDLKLVVAAEGDQFIPPLGTGFADSFSKGSNDIHASLGISRRVLEIYAVRLEYQRVFKSGSRRNRRQSRPRFDPPRSCRELLKTRILRNCAAAGRCAGRAGTHPAHTTVRRSGAPPRTIVVHI